MISGGVPWKRHVAAASCALWLPLAAAQASPLAPDEEVIFFPTAAHLSADARHWIVPIHGWVFEPERDSRVRKGVLSAAAAALDLDEGVVESQIFRERVAWFLVDNERSKRIDLNLSPDGRQLGPSRSNGHLRAEITLERRGTGSESAPFWLHFAALPPKRGQRSFAGEALMVPAEGLSVISDVDDTVKVSQVTDKQALLENTFLKPFAMAPGMAPLYRKLAERGAVFHYLTSSPWQLYPPLREFFDSSGLPKGSFHMRSFRLKDESFLNLFKSSREHKPSAIEALMADFPRRDFILVGDSGEADPEIYGDAARRHPGRVRAILIRNVTGERADDARFRDRAFRSLSSDRWLLFEDADAAAGFLAEHL